MSLIDNTSRLRNILDGVNALPDKEGGGGIGGVLRWNDLTDRPFYEEGEETVLFDDEITFSPSGEMKGITQIPYFEIEQGKTYKIDWNGHTYDCTSKQFEIDDGVFISYLGNAVLFEEEDTGENFLFYGGKDEAGENVSVAAYIPMTESKIPNERVIPCKIYYGEKIIHKLPNKFIDAEWMANDNAGTITILKEKEYTGGQTFRSYEETAINIKKAVEYESVTVICNGKEYECKPIYDEDDGSGEGDVFFLGNAGMWSEKYPNTGEPFMLMAYIGGAVILGVATEEPYTFGIKKKNIIPIPLKYLPKGYGCLGEKGTSDIIFEQEVAFEEDEGVGFGIIDQSIEFIEGDMYVLQLRETEYECVAKSLTQTMDGVTATATWIGNAGIMGMENTGEPFLIVTQPMGEDENGNLTYGTILATEVFLDENIPVKITHTTGTPTVQFDPALIPGEWMATTKYTDVPILEETSYTGNQTIRTSAGLGLSEKIPKCEKVKVIFNGTEYECSVSIIDSMTFLVGNGSIVAPGNFADTGEPFLVYGYIDSITYINVTDTTNAYTIKLVGSVLTYNTLPEEFLPERILSASHEHSNKELLDSYTQSESDIANAVSEAHKHGNKSELDKIVEGDVSKWNNKVDISQGEENAGKILRVNSAGKVVTENIPRIDWGENDESSDNFISNRTHYDSSYETTVFENVEVVASSVVNSDTYGFSVSSPYKGYFKEGKTYHVIYDGNDYYCETEAVVNNAGTTIYHLNYDGGESDEKPFSIHIYRNIYVEDSDYEFSGSLFTQRSTTHTFSIYECHGELKQLDEKFIPPTIARKEDLQNLGGGSEEKWELISEVTLEEDVMSIEFTDLSAYKKLFFSAYFLKNADATETKAQIYVDSKLWHNTGTYFVHKTQDKYTSLLLEELPDNRWSIMSSATMLDTPYNTDCLGNLIFSLPSTTIVSGKISDLKIKSLGNIANYMLAGGKYKLYGVRA